MRKINKLVIHCSATRASQPVDVADVRAWHKAKGWADIGYHYFIKRDGTLQAGRPEASVGAHVAGWNANSIGICMAGGISDKTWKPENNFTAAQWATLKRLLASLLKRYAGATVLGHRDYPKVAKACPCFDARAWARANGFPASPAMR